MLASGRPALGPSKQALGVLRTVRGVLQAHTGTRLGSALGVGDKLLG